MMKSYKHKTYKLSDRFITFPPLLNLPGKKIKYIDALVYTALKSFNSQYADINWFRPNRIYEEGCFPSYETIAQQSGLAKATVVTSIKRLENAKMITITKSNKVKVANHYWFPDLDQCFTIPFKLFRAEDLTPNEKAMLICIRQFYVGDELTCMFTEVISQIAKHLGLTYKTIYTQYQSLISKGYVIDKIEPYKTEYKMRVVKLSDKLNWIFKAEPATQDSDMNGIWKADETGRVVLFLNSEI